MLKRLFILYIIIFTVYAEITDNRGGPRIIYRPKRRLSDLDGPKFVLLQAEPPNYGPLFTPPLLADLAPSQSGAGASPTGLAQPPSSSHASSKIPFFDICF